MQETIVTEPELLFNTTKFTLLDSLLLANVCNKITINHVQCLQENSENDVDDKNELDINHMMKEEVDQAAHDLIRGDSDIVILSNTTKLKLLDSLLQEIRQDA